MLHALVQKIKYKNMTEFEKLVKDMRKAQKDYVATPYNDKNTKRQFLFKARMREEEVDAHLRALSSPLTSI